MIPIKTTIIGSLGILAGLGREELFINLNEIIPEDAVTVALKGDNGSGKSTLFNLALTPWREPPMLSNTLYEEFGAKGLRELEFEHGGTIYRSRIEIRQTEKTKGQKAFLHYWENEAEEGKEWTPCAMPDGTVSDGKTRTYDACLEHVLGPQSLYYLSAFRAQNGQALAEYDDPKGLMRDLLALDEPQALREKAKLVIRDLRREYEYVKDDAEKLDGKSFELSTLMMHVSTLENELPGLTTTKTAAAEAVALARADFEAATQGDADNVKIRRRREAAEQLIEDTKKRVAMDAATARGDLLRAQDRQKASAINTDTRRNRLKQAIEQHSKTLARQTDIMIAVSESEKIAEQIPERTERITKLREQAAKLNETTAAMRKLQADQELNVQAGRSVAKLCQSLKERAGYVNVVPCGGEAPYNTCPALQDAMRAKEEVPAAEQEIAKKRAEWSELKAEIDALNVVIVGLSAETSGIKDDERELDTLRNHLESVRRTAALAETIGPAKKQMEAAQADLAELEQQAIKAIADDNTEIQEYTERLAKVRTDGDAAIAAAQAELDALPIPDHAGQLIAARKRLEDAQLKQVSAGALADQKSADLAEARAKAKTLKDAIDSGDAIRKQAKHLENEIAHWHLLAVALQGVIDLSIEDAGPAISNTANGLLSEAYGPRFSTSIVTQREQTNGRLVECFDISVIDADSGIESSILKKSGGESVWLDKALTDAVGLYHQDAAGIHYECLFADESEDGLTQDRKAQFYRMDRAALALGGYKRKYFVSHNPEAWATADAVIDLESWRVE